MGELIRFSGCESISTTESEDGSGQDGIKGQMWWTCRDRRVTTQECAQELVKGIVEEIKRAPDPEKESKRIARICSIT